MRWCVRPRPDQANQPVVFDDRPERKGYRHPSGGAGKLSAIIPKPRTRFVSQGAAVPQFGSSPDSPLEEDGFELAVPPRRESLCAATPGKHRRLGPEPVGGSAFSCRRLRLATPRREPSQERDRWFESGSLQRRVVRTPVQTSHVASQKSAASSLGVPAWRCRCRFLALFIQPATGFGQRYAEMTAWLDANLRRGQLGDDAARNARPVE